MGEVVAAEATFASEAGPIEGFVARPADAGRHPAIILLSGIGGMLPQYRVVAEQFAAEGIVGVGLDWMMREKDPPDQVVMQDVDACARYLVQQDYVDAGQLVLSGYCRGGTLALLGLGQLPHFSAGVIFHGGPFYIRDRPSPFDMSVEKRPVEPYELAERYSMPLMFLHGGSDTVVPLEQMNQFLARLNDLGKEYEYKLYAATGHAFTLYGEAQGRWWHAAHAEDAFREAVFFMRRVYNLPLGTVAPLVPGARPEPARA